MSAFADDAKHVRPFPAYINTYHPVSKDVAPAAANKFSQSLQLSAGTDFAYRGITLVAGHSVLQGGYAAAYQATSAVNFAGGVLVGSEYDHGALHRPVYTYWATATESTKLFNVSANGYYFAIPADKDLLSVEIALDGKRKIAPRTSLSWLISAAPSFLSPYGNMLYVNAGFQIDPAPDKFDIGLKGHVGRQWADDNVEFGTPDYNEFELTLFTFWHKFDASLTATGTNVSHQDCFDGAHDCESRVIFTLSRAISL